MLVMDYSMWILYLFLGVAIPDPPEKITALATEFTDYVNLTKLTVHIAGHSPGRGLYKAYFIHYLSVAFMIMKGPLDSKL